MNNIVYRKKRTALTNLQESASFDKFCCPVVIEVVDMEILYFGVVVFFTKV